MTLNTARLIRGFYVLVVLLTLGTVVPLRAEGALAPAIAVEQGEVVLRDEVYYLDARIDFNLNEVVRDALESGVLLSFAVDIQIEHPRALLWSAEVATLTQRFTLRYHALSDRYVLTNLNTDESRSFLQPDGALDALGEMQDLPLIDQRLLDQGDEYEVWLRARLDLDQLPRPLKTVAYITPEWRLVSDWKVWRFRA